GRPSDLPGTPRESTCEPWAHMHCLKHQYSICHQSSTERPGKHASGGGTDGQCREQAERSVWWGGVSRVGGRTALGLAVSIQPRSGLPLRFLRARYALLDYDK